MAESICRALRGGALEGEHAPTLTIKDSLDSPFACDVFSYILVQLSSQILRGKSQSRIHILDCYTDPLGWKDKIQKSRNVRDIPCQSSLISSFYKDMKDMEKLFSIITELGGGLVEEKKAFFCVAIDSLSELLRLTTSQSVSGFLSNLRSHDQISCIFGLLHSDLHDDRVAAVLDYMSSMVANVEPFHHSLSEQSFSRGKFNVRFKRRNGRVRVTSEEFKVDPGGISFTSIPSADGLSISGLLPKVQFNLDLSEKERTDRANVVLPFEHQGNGKPIQIYDGRRSLEDYNIEAKHTSGSKKVGSGTGEIIYYRDSDDEMPDSDEDPDDDLDI
ncbi:elongator complex protein 5 isoform X2 [Neltuma alba]|uniref:elongator complex protein 5 isoform X2 n=1 Tax=Neltuma alba TaxID=207710 RepID=UPI0010A30CA3|nr:elongator complex protein 5-like isoform X2 [Prosopis alba]